MLTSIRNTFLIQLISSFLLALLALKTGGLLFSVFPDRSSMYSSVPIDIDSPECDESQEIKNASGKLVCLLTDQQLSLLASERKVEAPKGSRRILFVAEHFDVIPSPPPDSTTV